MKKISEKNKHIDVVVKYFFPIAAGIETNVMETYSVLAKKGWDVTIHTSKDTYLEKNILPDEENIRGLKVKRYSFTSFGYWPDIQWSQTDIVSLHNFDIFPHFQILVYSLLRKIFGKKKFALILTPHGGFNPEWSTFARLKALIKKNYHYTLGVMLINKTVDGVRAVSGWEKDQMIAKGIKAILVAVIDNGLEDEAYEDLEKNASLKIKEAIRQYGKYIIQVGRVYSIKNYEITIKALAGIPADVNYVIVGPVNDAEYKKKLENLIEKLGLKKRVFFVGIVRGVDKYYLMKRAQMMVHMAIWESYCNVVHEGLSQGLVCIVSNQTALPYLVKDRINGYCLDVKDSEVLSKKISYVLANKNSSLVREMEERNREFGLKNSWREVAGKMELFYNNIILKIYAAIKQD